MGDTEAGTLRVPSPNTDNRCLVCSLISALTSSVAAHGVCLLQPAREAACYNELSSGVNAALVTAPVFKTGETSFTGVWWVRFPSAPASRVFVGRLRFASRFARVRTAS